VDKALKVTPQRIIILDAIIKLKNHPTAENIIDFIRKNHPHISVGTVYKVLETLAENSIINKVNTEKDVMRYDADVATHHHIFDADSDRIEDLYDETLTEIIMQHFEKNAIPGFRIEDIKLHIIGRHINHI
jgi:Fur family peroxide stress response transcriptional regulator